MRKWKQICSGLLAVFLLVGCMQGPGKIVYAEENGTGVPEGQSIGAEMPGVGELLESKDFESEELTGWNSALTDPNKIEVIDDTTTSSKVLKINHEAEESSTRTISYNYGTNAKAVTKFVFSFDVMTEKATGALQFNPGGARLKIEKGKLMTNTGSPEEICAVSAGEWHSIAMVVDIDLRTFDVYMDGTEVLANEPFKTDDAITAPKTFTINPYKLTKNTFYMDNLNFYAYKLPTAISFAESAYSVEVSGTVQLGVSYTPENPSRKAVVYTSSDTSIATVDASTGVVTGVADGVVTITATLSADSNISAQTQVTVGAGEVVAAYTYTQDFESVAVGDAKPSGWSIDQVLKSTNTASIVKEGENSVWKIEHPDINTDGTDTKNMTMSHHYPSGAVKPSKLVVKYDVKAENDKGALILPNPGGVKLKLEGGELRKVTGSTTVAVMAKESWHSLEYVVDMEKDVYDVYLDGAAVLVNEALEGSFDSSSYLIFSVFKSTQNTFYVDNIEILEYVTGTSAAFAEAEYTLEIGEAVQTTLSLTPVNTSRRAAVYSSSDENIATVDAFGKVTGIAAGEATITADFYEEGLTNATATVKVQDAYTVFTYEQDFNAAEVGSEKTTEWTVSNKEGNNAASIVADADTSRGNAWKIEHTTMQTNGNMTMVYTYPSDAVKPSRLVLQYDIKVDNERGALYLPNPGGVRLKLETGWLKKATGEMESIAPIGVGKWHTVETAVDMVKGVYDVYLDGAAVLANEVLERAPASSSELRWSVYKATENTFYLDNIKIEEYVIGTDADFAQEEYSVGIGKSLQIPLSFVPENASRRTAAYTSSDETIATVDSVGNVTGIALGTATITATPYEAGLSPVTTTVRVENVKPTAITTTPEAIALPTGGHLFFDVAFTPENTTNQAVSYESADSTIATVDEWGEVVAVGAGTTTIKVTAEEPGEDGAAVTKDVTVTVSKRQEAVTKIYVNVSSGNDSNAGSSQSPVKTLAKAQELVKAANDNMTGDIQVILADGYYQLTETFTMTAEDGGNNQHYVIWTHEGSGEAVIGGGKQITGFTVYDAEKGIYVANAQGIDTRQLFVDGVRAVRAKGSVGLSGPVTLKNGNTNIGYTW